MKLVLLSLAALFFTGVLLLWFRGFLSFITESPNNLGGLLLITGGTLLLIWLLLVSGDRPKQPREMEVIIGRDEN
jgi:hypothetical protein